MAKIISSQRFLSKSIVKEKRLKKDYDVYITPKFNVDGVDYAAIIDGHHSYAAAMEDNARPNMITATVQDDDRVGLINNGKIDEFLMAAQHDCPWYDIKTGADEWD